MKYQKLPSGNSDYIEFYDKNGEMVATYANNGWTMYTTNAEASRQTEMCMIYNEAWGTVRFYNIAVINVYFFRGFVKLVYNIGQKAASGS